MKKPYGFTIVELLIVIVVISVLAALSYVGYVNVTDKTHDSVVRSDLVSLAKKIQLINTEAGEYPNGGGAQQVSGGASTGNGVVFNNMSFAANTGSYLTSWSAGDPSRRNLIYCKGPNLADGSASFKISATSKSGRVFSWSTFEGLRELGVIAIGSGCEGLGWPRSWSYGYYYSPAMPQGWASWTN